MGRYVVVSVISAFVNACSNKRPIGYSYAEQQRDIVPGAAPVLAFAAAVWPLSLAGLPDIVLVVVCVERPD